MYLDFVVDIIKVGDSVFVTCGNEKIEGVVEKINKDFIAIKQFDGSITVKSDSEITNIQTSNKDTKEAIVNSSTNNSQQIPKDSRGGMIYIKKDKAITFYCSRCKKMKTAKKYAIDENNSDIMICNACYGYLLSKQNN